jgi:hypothetical protein
MAEGGNVQIERISTKKDITQRSFSESDVEMQLMINLMK